VSADGIVTFGSIGYFPWINIRILIIVNEAFHLAVQMYQVGISHLLPATPTLAYRVSVPCSYLIRGDFTA
jgi:hypothetical protein